MLEYTNQYKKDLVTPDTKVWRYFGLRSLLATAKEQKLRFSRVDTFDDPFEGSVPEIQNKNIVPLFIAAGCHQAMMFQVSHHFEGMAVPQREDLWVKKERLQRARIGSAHACCWSYGDESEAFWQLYCREDGAPKGLGVALQTTMDKLMKSVARYDLYISPVNYRFYHTGDDFTHELDCFFNKRKGFQFENEVRLLAYDSAHFAKHLPMSAAVPELSKYLCFDWSILSHVEQIVISPYADEVYEEIVNHLLGKIDTNLLTLLKPSVLNPRHYKVNL
jgi:hypothetical protein